MQNLSQAQILAMSEAFDLAKRKRFVIWVSGNANQLGDHPIESIQAAYDSSKAEWTKAGVDTEARQFTYACARLLMPQMSARQFVLAMDVVFGSAADPAKLGALLAIRTSQDV